MKPGKRSATNRAAEVPQRPPQKDRVALQLSPRVWRLLGVIFLLTAVWVVYRPALDAPFIFDDGATILHNSSIVHLWPLVSATDYAPLQAPPEAPVHGRPLVNLTFATNYHFNQLQPRPYRVVNIFLHVANALLLWVLVRRTLRLPYFHERITAVAEPLGFATALAWALHPLATECVIYITQRTELMMALCYYGTMYAALRYWEAARRGPRALWCGAAIVICALGMLCKESMATVPVLALLFERTFIAGTFRRALRDSWPLYLGLVLAWTPLVALNFHGTRTPMVGFHLGVSGPAWWFTQAKVLLLYLKLAVWPWPLVIHYEMPFLETLSTAWPWVLGAGMLAIGAIVLVARGAAAGFVMAGVFVLLSPTLVVPISTEVAAERRMYVPLALLISWAVVGGYQAVVRLAARANDTAQPRRRWSPLLLTATGVLTVATIYGVLSTVRANTYETDLRLWSDTEKHQPDSVTVHINLGLALEQVGRSAEAIEHYQRAIELQPDYFFAHYKLAHALEASGRTNEARTAFAEASKLRPDFAAGHYDLGRLLQLTGQLQQAQEEYDEALRLYPNFPRARFALGTLFEKMDDPDSAQREYEEALRLHPDFPAAHRNLGIILGRSGQVAAALPHFEAVRQLAPSVDAFSNLAVAYSRLQRPTEALAAAQAASQMARAQGQKAEAERLEQWAAHYRRSQPNATDKSPPPADAPAANSPPPRTAP